MKNSKTSKKASEVFLRFVDPLFDSTPVDVTPEQLKQILTTPMLIWNALVLKQWGKPVDYIQKIFDAAKKGQTVFDSLMVDKMLHMWIQRKEESFDDELWAIQHLQVYRDFDGIMVVRVSVGAPEELQHTLPSEWKDGTNPPVN